MISRKLSDSTFSREMKITRITELLASHRTGRTKRFLTPELFDFSNSLWSTRYSNFASMSFDEELELYDLLELDAVGEEDPETADIDLDGTTQDILGV